MRNYKAVCHIDLATLPNLAAFTLCQGIFNAIFRRFEIRSQSHLNEIHDATSSYVHNIFTLN